jgi:hypothetical protein
MEPLQFPRTCRYATPTLFLQWPYWLDAWSWPWSCTQEGRLRLLSSDVGCRTCARLGVREAGVRPPAFDTTQSILKG